MAAAGGDGGGRQRLMDDMFNRMPGAPVGPTGVSKADWLTVNEELIENLM